VFGWLSKRQTRIETGGKRYLNLGCGGQVHPEWVSVDLYSNDERIIAHDLRQALPFADQTFDAVYHSHVLEHLPKNDAPRFMRECFRVLRPGGFVRVVVPDLEAIARLYLQNLDLAMAGDKAAKARHEWMLIELLDQMVREHSGGEMAEYWRKDPMPAEEFVFSRVGREARDWIARSRANPAPVKDGGNRTQTTKEELQFRKSGETHRWMYDRLSLETLLRECGFIEFYVRTAHDSAIPQFVQFAFDIEPDGSIRKPDSLFVEAQRPA
jgi:predicted SAM-dependent methyltransferase